MKQSYPASPAQLRLLRRAPAAACCLPCGGAEALRPLSGMTVYLRLRGGGGLWYLIRRAENGLLLGHALTDRRWVYVPVRIGSIIGYY